MTPFVREIARRWAAVSSHARQRLLLGALAAVGLLVRDLLLIGFTASVLALVELMPGATTKPPAKAAPPSV